ncbi:FAD-dependent oxidoreductase [Luedemannella flava]|uniref:FAD-dependent oxidoreductase n=1 Tax=Luedemannella flava TaxID=349316 RepID=A0ABP4Y9P4_9ACTN
MAELTSYWTATSATTDHPRLAADIEVDVAVIGGGIAGICTAWELARAGRGVVVLEADRVAASTTGNTTAKVSAAHGLVYDRLRSSMGAEVARLYASAQLDALGRVRETVADLGIACDLEERASYCYVTDPGQVGPLRDEADAASAAGLPASLVTATGLPFAVAAAVRVDGQAQFHPRGYLLALADDLVARGGQIVERTRVTSMDAGEPCRLVTEAGATVTATDVVVATHYPFVDRVGLFSRLKPRRELVVAGTIPADADPEGMYLTTEENTRSVRTAPYREGQRLLIVTGEHFTPGDGDVESRWARLADWATANFGVEGLSYRWAAQDNLTPDRMPFVGALPHGKDHAYVATGFNAWGMTNGVMAGRLLAALLTGRSLPWAPTFDPSRVRPLVEGPAVVRANTAVAAHFVGDRMTTGAGSVAELPAGAGAVIRVDGQRRAVYRDDAGQLHAVSATCTHLGCTVAFNDAERTWDCPCHGSRFDPDGAVLHGPATTALPPAPEDLTSR